VAHSPRDDHPRGGSWRAQPVVWLGIAVLAATIAACVWLIVVSAGDDDAAIRTDRRIFGVPTQQPSPAPPR
jgi:hypothetical protein